MNFGIILLNMAAQLDKMKFISPAKWHLAFIMLHQMNIYLFFAIYLVRIEVPQIYYKGTGSHKRRHKLFYKLIFIDEPN